MNNPDKTMVLTESELEILTDEELAEHNKENKKTEDAPGGEDEPGTPLKKEPTGDPISISKVPASSNETMHIDIISTPPPVPSSIPAPRPTLPTIIDDRYQVCRCLGQGAMGAVYEVKHLRLDKLFAMKVIHPQLAKQEKLVARFHREATALSRLEHPNCVRVTDFGQATNGDLYLVMELVEGVVVSELVARGPLCIEEAIEVTRQTLLGLSHAHEAGIIHRDIKLENLIKTPNKDGSFGIKILDFGLAKEELAEANEEALTAANEILGTPQYIAPEAILKQTMNHQTDLYAMGVGLFYMLIGRPVFAGNGPLEVLQSKLQGPAPKLNDVGCGKFPSSLEEFLVRALAEPNERFSSADEMLDALNKIAQQFPLSRALSIPLKQVTVAQLTVYAIRSAERAAMSALIRGKDWGHAVGIGVYRWWQSKRADGRPPWVGLIFDVKNKLNESFHRLTRQDPDDSDKDA
jgi:serine/threonine protein kinase